MNSMVSCNENIRLVNFLEDVLKSAIVFLQDGVLGGQELQHRLKPTQKETKGDVPVAFF